MPSTEYLSPSTASDLTQTAAFFGSVAGIVRRLHTGVGFSAAGQHHALRRQAGNPGIIPGELTANYGIMHMSVGHGFLDGQVALGVGPRLTGVSFDASSAPKDLQVRVEMYGLPRELAERVLSGDLTLLTARKIQRSRTRSDAKPRGPIKRLLHLLTGLLVV